jgi:hypothetical protein
VSAEGLAITLYERENSTELAPVFLGKEQSVELMLELPPGGEHINGVGSLRWLDMGSVAATRRYVTAGIFLAHMRPEDRVVWEQFVATTAAATRPRVSAA